MTWGKLGMVGPEACCEFKIKLTLADWHLRAVDMYSLDSLSEVALASASGSFQAPPLEARLRSSHVLTMLAALLLLSKRGVGGV